MSLSAELRNLLRDAGAALTAFGDLSGVEAARGYPAGVSVAVPVPVSILREIEDGPTMAYYDMYHELNARLNQIVKAGECFLRERGYDSLAQSTDVIITDGEWRTSLPHKTVATRAGLGWIGKNCLLATPEFGPAVRISSLLTNAPLEFGNPVNQSRCGGCQICKNACPAQAIKGTLWNPSVERVEIINKEDCKKKQTELMKARTGLETDLCGKCFVVCPYTRRYMERVG